MGKKTKRFIVKKISRKAGIVREYITLVDEEDAHLLRAYFWTITGTEQRGVGHPIYVSRVTPNGVQMLHHAILGVSADERVSHINGDSLDNRKCNLLVRSERVTELPD